MDINNSILISELISANKKLEAEVIKLRDENELKDQISKMVEKSSKRKPYFSSSRATKARLRKDIRQTILLLNKKLKSANLTVRTLKVVEENNQNYEDDYDFIEISPLLNSDPSKEKLLYIKDRLLISDRKYDLLE